MINLNFDNIPISNSDIVLSPIVSKGNWSEVNFKRLENLNDKNLSVLKVLLEAEIIDPEGQIVSSLRSSPDVIVPSTYSFHLTEKQIKSLLWNEKHLFTHSKKSGFFVGLLLGEIYELASQQTLHRDSRINTYAEDPAQLDIELDSETTWNILFANGQLKAFARACIYQENSEDQKNIIDDLIDHAGKNGLTKATPTFTIYTPVFTHESIKQFVTKYFQKSFPGSSYSKFASTQTHNDSCKIVLSFANGNVCLVLKPKESFSPVTTDDVVSLSVTRNCLQRNMADSVQEKVYLKLRKHNPEHVLLNKLFGKFELLDQGRSFTLEDMLYSNSTFYPPTLKNKLLDQIRTTFRQINLSEDSFQKYITYFGLTDSYLQFFTFALTKNVNECRNAFFLFTLLNQKISQEHLYNKKKDPKVAHFVIEYCRMLQGQGIVTNHEIALVYSYLNQKKCVRKSYKHDPYAGLFNQAVLSGLPFNVACAWTTLITTSFSPSRCLGGISNLPLSDDFDWALKIMTDYFRESNHLGDSSLSILATELSEMLQREQVVDLKLTLQNEYDLEKLVNLILKSNLSNVYTAGLQLALVFNDMRFMPACISYLPLLLQDPFSNTRILNFLHKRILDLCPIDTKTEFDATSVSDWNVLLFDLCQKNKYRQVFEDSFYSLILKQKNGMSTLWDRALADKNVDQLWYLLNTSLNKIYKFDDKRVISSNLVIGIISFFKLIDKFELHSQLQQIPQAEMTSFLTKLSIMQGLTLTVDATNKYSLNNETRAEYQKHILACLNRASKIKISELQNILLDFVLSGQIAYSSKFLKTFSLLEEFLPLEDSVVLGRTRILFGFSSKITKMHWTIFKNAYLHEIVNIDEECSTRVALDEFVESQVSNHEYVGYSEHIIELDKSETVFEEIKETGFKQNLFQLTYPVDQTPGLVLQKEEDFVSENIIETHHQQTPKQETILESQAASGPFPQVSFATLNKLKKTGLKTKKKKNSRPKKKVPKSVHNVLQKVPVVDDWLNDFKNGLISYSFKHAFSEFSNLVKKYHVDSNQKKPLQEAFDVFFNKFMSVPQNVMSLANTLSNQVVLDLYVNERSKIVNYYSSLSDSWGEDNVQHRQEILLHLSSMLANGSVQEKYEGVDTLTNLLNRSAGKGAKLSIKTLEKMQRYLGMIVEGLSLAEKNDRTFQLLEQANLLKIHPMIAPEVALNIANSMQDHSTSGLAETISRFNIYKMLVENLSINDRMLQTKEGFKRYLSLFICFEAFGQATECALLIPENNEQTKRLVDKLFDGAKWSYLERLLQKSNVVSSEYVMKWLETDTQADLATIVEIYLNQKEIIIQFLPEEEKTFKILNLVELLQKSRVCDRRQWSLELLTSFKIPSCRQWETTLKEHSKKGAAQKLEAWKICKDVYGESLPLMTAAHLLEQMINAGWHDADLSIDTECDLIFASEDIENDQKIMEGGVNKFYLNVRRNWLRLIHAEPSVEKQLEMFDALMDDCSESGMPLPPPDEMIAVISTLLPHFNGFSQFEFSYESLSGKKALKFTEDVVHTLEKLYVDGMEVCLAKEKPTQIFCALEFFFAHIQHLTVGQRGEELYENALRALANSLIYQNDYATNDERVAIWKTSYDDLIGDVFSSSQSLAESASKHFSQPILGFLDQLLSLKIPRVLAGESVKYDLKEIVTLNFLKIIRTNSRMPKNFDIVFKKFLYSHWNQDTEVSKTHHEMVSQLHSLMKTQWGQSQTFRNFDVICSIFLNQFIDYSAYSHDDVYNCYIEVLFSHLNQNTTCNVYKAFALFNNNYNVWVMKPNKTITVFKSVHNFYSSRAKLKPHWVKAAAKFCLFLENSGNNQLINLIPAIKKLLNN